MYYFKLRTIVASLAMGIATALSPSSANAEGSKDLYKSTTAGYRNYLLVSATQGPFNPFPNSGVHKVYVKAGEVIYAGSSLVGVRMGTSSSSPRGKVEIVKPNGTIAASSTDSTKGRIMDRNEELRGPRRPGVTNGYRPLSYKVKSGEEGIFEVRFYGNGDNTNIPEGAIYRPKANATSWTQFRRFSSSEGAGLIMAWDVSVGTDYNDELKTGRVYTNVLNLTGPNGQFNESAFYGKVYVTTPEGFVYQVDNNGLNGASFNFFSNNKGRVSIPNNFGSPASYLSIDGSELSDIRSQIWDPRKHDSADNITNKIFYNIPAQADFPDSALVHINGVTKKTWLKAQPKMPAAEGVVITCEGNIAFYSNVEANYRIMIDVNNNGVYDAAEDVELTGVCAEGLNTISWDGKNNAGEDVAEATISISVRATVAEIHFPFVDVEANRHGILINRLDSLNNIIANADTVYWNDNTITHTSPKALAAATDPKVNLSGISSAVNGHKWYTSDSMSTTHTDYYGNNKTLDTWTYAYGEAKVEVEYLRCLHIAGAVYLDTDGDGIKSSEEALISGADLLGTGTISTGEKLFVYLTSADDMVIDKSQVDSSALYRLDVVPFNTDDLKLVLTTEDKSFGERLNPNKLKGRWTFQSEATPGNPTTQLLNGDGTVQINTTVVSFDNQNFGIQVYPETVENSLEITDKLKKGDPITLNGLLFVNNVDPTKHGTYDSLGGYVTHVKIVEFPENADSIRIGGSMHTASTWDPSGVSLEYSPINGVDSVQLFLSVGTSSARLDFAAVDNAGAIDPTPGYIKVTLTEPLSVNIANFEAYAMGCEAKAMWQLGNTTQLSSYSLEAGSDGSEFHSIASWNVAEEKVDNFTFNLSPSLKYVRLKTTSTNGDVKYSKVKVLNNTCTVSQISLYPNPTTGLVYLENTTDDLAVYIYDATGKELYKNRANNNLTTINIENYAAGTYSLQVRNKTGQIHFQTILVKK